MEIEEFNKSVLKLFSEYEIVSEADWEMIAITKGKDLYFRNDEISFYINKERCIVIGINIEEDESILDFVIMEPYTEVKFQSSYYSTHEQLLDELVIFKELMLEKILSNINCL